VYTIKYFDDNVYTEDISKTSDIEYVKTFNLDYNFSTEKSIVSDYINSTACVCFYKNKGTNIFPTGRYKEKVIVFSDESFYQNSDLNHNLDNVIGYRSSSTFLGSSEVSFYFSNDCGIKISFNDVYGVSFSFWIYVDSNVLYVKDNGGLLYTHIIEGSTFSFGFYNGVLVVNSEDVITVVGKFLPYDLFLYGDFNDINIVSKYSIPVVLEGTGDVKDDIYGDAYYITKPAAGLGYLKSKANNVLTSCSGFVFDIAFRAVGNSIPFSLSDGASFNGSNFVMNNANMWVEFDIVNSVFYSNIVTSSGVVTISGVASECNNYYLMRCYYEDNRFGVILNGIDTNTVCGRVTISGGYLNLLTYNTLIVDSFALYKDISPPLESYNQSLAKLITFVSNTALVNSHDANKVLFGVDNFFPEDYYYSGTWSGIESIPIISSNFDYYVGYSLAGGEAELSNDYFYASRLLFDEGIYNCFVCENDKTLLTYFSGITVPANKIMSESFTNYNYVSDDFITTNSGLYIRSYSKVFNPVSSASVIEFSDVGWTGLLSIGVLFESDSIPTFPDDSCAAATGSGNLYIGTTAVSGLSINSNTSIYFYLDNLSVVVSGSNTGVLGSGVVSSSYDYVRYFIKSNDTEFAAVNNIYTSTTQREVDTLTNKFFSYELPEYYNLDDSYTELFYNIGSSVSSNGITVYDSTFYDHECSFSSYYDATFSGMFNVSGYSFLGISDNFENGFIIERWRQVCSPYGIYGCNQPGWASVRNAGCYSCTEPRVYDGNLSTSVHPDSDYVISVGNYYYIYLTNTDVLIDTISIYVTSYFINPGDGFVIECDIDYYGDGVGWHTLINNYVSATVYGTSWPIRHDIAVPLTRCDDIRIKANSDWDEVVPTEIRPSCFYNYGGTAVCVTYLVNDDFTGLNGSTPNSDLWYTNESTSGTVTIQNDKLRYTLNTAGSSEYSYIYSKYELTGDFDFQCDFSDLVGGNELAGTGFELRFKVDDSNNMFIKARFPLTTGFNSRITIGGSTSNYYDTRTNSYGKLKVTRLNDFVILYYLDGGGNWTIGHTAEGFSTNDGEIILGTWAPASSGLVSVYVDNFLLNLGTVVLNGCAIDSNTHVHVVLDDYLYVYSEYVLEDSFSLSFSGINYYPLNSKLHLKDYSGNECYVKTDWITSSECNITASSAFGDIVSTASGVSDSVEYTFSASRFLDKINLAGHINSSSGTSVYSNYSFSADNLGVGLIFYNKSLPNVAGCGYLFGFESDDYTVNFSSIAVGYKYTALDGTGNITKAGIGFNTNPPNLFVDKIKGSYAGQSHKACQELTSSGLHFVSSNVDNNISIGVGGEEVGGVQQVSKFNRISLFSDYSFMPTIFYRTYLIGGNQKYASFSEVSSLVQDGDKVYFYPGSYTVTTDKQIYIIGVGHPTDIHVSINNASGGITVISCTTTRCQGSGVFNMYNCYILPWTKRVSQTNYIILYDVVNMYCYNCDLYNYSYTSYYSSYLLLHKCAVYRTLFYRVTGSSITIYNEGYDTRGYYGYGPEFNRVRVISGLSHVESIKVLSFYYNSIYNHFPLHNQSAIGPDSCSQLITGEDTYSVYFYGDLKKLNSFSMYLFIQDLDGVIEIKNSSDFVFTVDSNNLNCGISLVIKIYGLEINMSVPISHSNVFKLAVIAVVFDGGSISIYLNGAKLATKYIIVVDFNDPSSYLNDSVLFFDDSRFVCDGNGLLLKGAALYECVDFLLGTHVEEEGSNSSVQTRVNMEFSTFPVLTEYHGVTNYYGYSAYNTGAGVYYDASSWEYKRIYFKANKSCKTSNNMTVKYVGTYKVRDINGNCINESKTTYISPPKNDSVTFSAAKIDGHTFGYCDIIDPYGYATLYLFLPLPAIEHSSYCFDATFSAVMLSFDLSSNPYSQDIGPNHLTCNWHDTYYGGISSKEGVFHTCAECRGGDYFYINHYSVLNLNNNFTIEFLFTHFNDNGFAGTLLTKGTITYNIAYRVGINSRHIPYFTWSWEGDNTVYANKQIRTGGVTYLCIVVGINSVSFYINGESAGIKYTDKLTIINNSEQLRIMSGYYASSNYKKQVSIEELCIVDAVKTENEIINTWNKISGGDSAPWIKINNVVVSSDKPIKISPSDRFIESDGKIDISKWEYRSYIKPQAEEGLVLDSRLTKKIKSKVISYNVIFDVSIFCEFLEYSTNRNWSVKFKYKFISGNYITIVINYVKYDSLYVYCEYYYNGYKSNTSSTSLALSPCGVRFITDYSGYTYVQIGDRNFWYTVWTSTQNLFVETSGWLEVTLNNDDWDSWFVVKLTNFLSRQYCGGIPNGVVLNFYDAVPYGRAFYSQMPEDVANLTLNNDLFEIDFSSAGNGCVHSLEFVNGDLSDSHVLYLNNNIFDNVNYETFNIELLVYLTYDNTKVLDLFPWINIDVKNKYLYIVMNDNDHTIIDSISQAFNDYVYIAISIGNPHTTLHVNDQVFIYDTNFTKLLPYHFYPIGKSFSGRVVYFCGYYGSFDEVGYKFRVNSLSRYIGFDNCGRKVFGSNMVTSLDQCSIIYSYDNPVYSTCLKSFSYTLSYNENVDVKILTDPAVLQSIVDSVVVIRCGYSSLEGKKTTSVTVSATEHTVSHNYYDSFGDIGGSISIFSYDLVGTCYDNDSVFYLRIDNSLLEKILTGVLVLNIKNNETKTITSINVYLNGELSINDVYGSSLLV